MAGAFRIAEGYVEVTADKSGYDRSMERLKSTRHTVKVGLAIDKEAEFSTRLARLTEARSLKVNLALDKTALSKLKLTDYKVNILPVIPDAALRRVQAQLDRLTADRTVRILASADTRVAADELRNLTRRQRVRIGVDVDTRVAADEINNLTRTRTARINADLHAGDTAARLDALARNRRVGLDVDVRGGGLSALSGGAGGIGSMVTSLMSLKSAAVGAFPMLASLGQSLAQMGPLAAVAVPAVLSLGTAFAAIKIGTSGIGDAIKASLAPASSSGASAASSLHAVQRAQESLARATQGVRDAEVNAAAARVKAARDIKDAQQSLKGTVRDVADSNHSALESVASAERDLTQAQRTARQAQLDLTAARKAAKVELEDLNNQLTDSQLSQRSDVLALQDAQQELDAVKAKGASASQEDVDKAQLAYDQAVQALAEQQTQTQRLTDQTAAANRAGVEGSGQVAAAKQAIADANQAVGDKAQALADAQHAADEAAVDGAQRVAKAERDVADARAAAAKAAVDGARSIADANQAVTDAARSLVDAQNSGAAAVNKTAEAMAKLAPNARSFVAAIVGLKGAWTGLKLDVQNRLFAGLGGSFTTMARASLPALHAGLVGTAGVLNTMAKNALGAVTNLAKTGTLRKLFDGLTGGLKPLSRVPGQFVTALGQIGVAASPAFAKLTTAAGGFADRLSKQITAGFKNGHLEEVINNALGIAKQFFSLLGDIAGTVGNVFKAAAAGGGDALGALGETFKELRKITAMPEVQKGLTSIFKLINTVAKLFVGALGVTLIQLVKGFAPIADAITKMLSGLGNIAPLLGGILLAVNPVLGVFVLLAPLLGQLAKPIVGLVSALAPLLTMLSNFAGGLFKALAPVIGALIDVLSAVLKSIAPVFAKVAPVILDVVTAIAGPLATVMQSLIPAIGPLVGIMSAFDLAMLPLVPKVLQLLPPLAQLAVSLLNLTTAVLMPLMPVVTGLAALLSGVLGGAIGVLVPVITTVIGWLTTFTNAVTNAVQWIVDKFTWLYDVLVGHSIIPDLVNGIIGWFTTLWNQGKAIFDGLRRDVVAIWNALWSGLKALWRVFWSGLQIDINAARTWIGGAFSALRTAVTSTWSGLWNGVRSTFNTVISAVRTSISSFASGTKTAFTSLRDSLGSIWNGIRSKFSAPVKFVIQSVYNDGIRAMWNSIASKISSKISLPAIPLKFATGGVVPGSGKGDTVPAMLTPNERVLSLAQVAKLGGHRGIDAMLGIDRPAGTGGNPTSAQDRKIRQPLPAFGLGGIVGSITDKVTGAVGSAASWAKNVVVGGLKAAAEKAIKALVQPLINRIPGGAGVGGLLKDMSSKALSGMLGFLGGEDKKATGGAGVQRGLAWARTQEGKPYQWAGNGNPSWDCSGLVSAIESVLRGESPHRRWATGAFSGSTAPSGWVHNLVSPFMIGITNAGVGHTAGTIGGVNVESRGGAGILVGPRARGYNDSLFTDHYGFEPATKYDAGGLLAPGATMAVNRTGRPERVLTADQTAKIDALLTSAAAAPAEPAGDTYHLSPTINVNGGFDLNYVKDRRKFATELVREMNEALRVYNRSRRGYGLLR